MASDMLHHSVLLQEVVDALGPADGHYYLDATFGNGGYSRALLEQADCCVVAIDRDPDAIQRGAAMQDEFAGRFVLVEGCFSDLTTLIKSLPSRPHGLRNGSPEKLDGAAFDLACALPNSIRLNAASLSAVMGRSTCACQNLAPVRLML